MIHYTAYWSRHARSDQANFSPVLEGEDLTSIVSGGSSPPDM